MIKIIDGDLMTATEDIIGHQVNCQGVMGSGVAKQIKSQYPEAFRSYQSLCNRNTYAGFCTNRLLGQCQIIRCKDKLVCNIFGQDRYGLSGKNTSEVDLFSSLKSLFNYAKENNYSVALPWKIGCARGGASWDSVYKYLVELFGSEDVTLTLYQLDLG